MLSKLRFHELFRNIKGLFERLSLSSISIGDAESILWRLRMGCTSLLDNERRIEDKVVLPAPFSA